MRRDMHKVIVERKRLGGETASRRPPWEKHARLEQLPKKEGLRKRHILSRNQKSLNENLAPLKRYLRKQVGRPWNAIYRDISAQLKATSAVKQHVRDHLVDCVELHATVGPKGQVYRAPQRRGSIFGRLLAGDLYVDPRTGILRVGKPWRRDSF